MFRLRSLTIRTRILAFQLIVAVAVTALCASAFIAIQNFHYYLARGTLAHRQLAAIGALARDAEQYSGTIAALLMTGEPKPEEVAEQQRSIATGFQKLESLTREEGLFLAAHASGETQQIEFDRLNRMRDLYDDMNRRYEALLTMREAGQTEAAIRVFFRDIDRRLSEELEGLIDEGVAGEISEVEAADRDAKALVGALAEGIGVTAGLVLLATVAAGLLLYRSIMPPIGRLSAGAVAIGRGDLSFRVGRLGEDELGLLARRFDEMAARIEEQQKLLLSARDDLEAEVLARTRELQVANQSLRDRDSSRVRFLADISHELRTPLTVLRGEAEVTLRGRPSGVADYREALQKIVEQAREMSRLVDDLLILARSETEDIRFEKEAIDLSEIAAEAAREASVLGRPRGVGIESAFGAMLTIEGDRQRMKQVLMIAVDNAIKYSEPGGSVRLETAIEESSAVVTIRNRHGDIDAKELPRLFDRFYRGRDAAAFASAGSGLGLAIARWMVEKQGGAIALEKDGADIKVVIAFPLIAGLSAPAGAMSRAPSTVLLPETS